ncbi:MAG: hypothetical protein H6573_19250 [Lewinellaceae bacterium]|nr:hypothetical protein [Phaeodactylibacter sp.]MCB0615509.1 hypothetical protein [Phaeodactylibacter sp.]MCB9349625.1 hypothetical protein [Lewinellaceae bacterium]
MTETTFIMSSYAVPVNYSPGLNQVILRDLRGHQEQAVEGTGTLDALLLLDGLLLRMQDGKLPCKPPELATADRDRLLAAIYKRTYLDKIESAITCEACQSAFDLDFSLDALLTQLQPDKTLEGIARLDDGTFRLAGGVHFRLPTGEDELAVLGLSPDEAAHLLLKRCLLDGDLEQDTARMQEAMQVIAPLMDMDLAACCPECGHQQWVHFNMQSFLLTALLQEQSQLAWEVHRLASAYQWSLNEILDLPRRLRRAYVRMIDVEMETPLYR